MARIAKIVLGVVGGFLVLGLLMMTFSDGILFYFSKDESVTSAFYVENAEAALAEQHRDVAARVAYAPLREKFVAVRREIDSLEAWEGAPGASYDEMVDWN